MTSQMRHRVSEEAARLLYYRHVREYKPAKDAAAQRLGVATLPSNREVATALDHLADEVEGPAREALRVALRRDALTVMRRLQAFHPRLIGSVWRGTARQGSDIDLEVFSPDPDHVLCILLEAYPRARVEDVARTAAGTTDRFRHVHFLLPSGYMVEVVLHGLEAFATRRTCEIYGDTITGLTLPQLERVLATDPTQRFLPKER